MNSGDCYKVKLLAEQLSLPCSWIPIDIMNKETRFAAYQSQNPNGTIPLLQLADGRYLPESNALLHCLAAGSDFLPVERDEHAQMLQWLFFEQYSHEPYIATARYLVRDLGRAAELEPQLAAKMAPGYKALQVMATHLDRLPFFVGGRYTMADIGLFAYTHVAEEGGYALSGFPAVGRWMERVRAQPGFIALG